jgi:hypothetical protein
MLEIKEANNGIWLRCIPVCLADLTVSETLATILALVPASSDMLEYEGQHMKNACTIRL